MKNIYEKILNSQDFKIIPKWAQLEYYKTYINRSITTRISNSKIFSVSKKYEQIFEWMLDTNKLFASNIILWSYSKTVRFSELCEDEYGSLSSREFFYWKLYYLLEYFKNKEEFEICKDLKIVKDTYYQNFKSKNVDRIIDKYNIRKLTSKLYHLQN